MKPSTRAAPPGRWIKTLEGYKAYQPAPLPSEIIWTPQLVRILSQADRLLGRGTMGSGRCLLIHGGIFLGASGGGLISRA